MMTLRFTLHATQRMFERQISTDDVRRVLESGELIASLPDRMPVPSYTVLGFINGRPVHVIYVAGERDERFVITVYDPSEHPELWSDDYRRRVK